MPYIRISFTVTIFVLFSIPSFAWDLNDVSYLMPIPSDLETSGVLAPSTEGRGGALIPAKLFERLPPLAFSEDEDGLIRSIRLVSLRIDPCFPLPTPLSCQRQIRMVWQPYSEIRGQLSSIDGSLHTFYVLTEAEFSSLLQNLLDWKSQFTIETRHSPLQIHPAWSTDGDSSPALTAFNKIMLNYAGQENLTRLTAMVLRGTGNAWVFAGFDVLGEELKIKPVPRLTAQSSQGFLNSAIPFDHFGGSGIQPPPRGPDTFNTLVSISDIIDQERNEELILKEVQAAFRIENPRNYNPENMDCVSCHVTLPAIQWVLNKKPHLKAEEVWNQEIYRNPRYSLQNLSPELWNTRIIRGFGYFGRQMAISQRVINESAEVADSLNLNYPEPKLAFPKVRD